MRDGFGRKLSDEETAKITGRRPSADATGHHARPHVRSHKEGVAGIDPLAPPGSSAANVMAGNGPGRDREVIDEP